jgi:hypothetical protein
MTVETALARNTKIVVPMNTELVNIIGDVAGLVPLAGRGTTPEKFHAGLPMKDGALGRPFKSNGGQ